MYNKGYAIFFQAKFLSINRPNSFYVDGAQLEYRQLAFSGDGKKLVSLSGVPDFKMTLW